MSAESPVRIRGSYSTGSGSTSLPAVVTPQPVTDKSLFDSVAAVINEVVPNAYTTNSDSNEQVQWVRFESTDIANSDINGSVDSESSTSAPLWIILGYGNGIQVWSVPATGEAIEVLSWRQGSVRVLRILPTPSSDYTSVSSDLYAHKRPLIALCDTISPGPHFCSLGFISLKDGDQVKSIQFKNPILDVLANRSSVVVTFVERIAIFDALTLEDRMTVTTCYPSTGLCPNPVALGLRWLAYSERMLVPMWRSKGGCEGEGVSSYTATMIHAAKSLGKGLRELGETVASSLTGTGMPHHAVSGVILGAETTQPGIVTILDIETMQDSKYDSHTNSKKPSETVLAHFSAHSEPIVNLTFDPTGLLLLTADKRGHDFHLFRIHPHPCGSSLAAVHHLYVLHRGDTTSKVQDVSFSRDSRWVAVSTSRGTTHVFPITPYGGPVGVRTHATPHVVNRLSRFHRSAGLTIDGRSDSPVSSIEMPCAVPYINPRLPPFPHPTVVYPLSQIRQPSRVGSGISPQTSLKSTAGRQRTLSSSEDTPNLKICAVFAPPRAWLLEPRDSSRSKNRRSAIDSLFIVGSHGSLIQYDLDPRHATNTPREKVCDDTSIELFVEARARWMLLRRANSCEIQVPLSGDNPLLDYKLKKTMCSRKTDDEDRWLSQVEIMTHAGPHRRLWMGPQFMFKTYNGSLSVVTTNTDAESIEVSVESRSRPARSNPVNMPLAGGGMKPLVPVLIESTSASSYEQSPRLLELHRNSRRDSDSSTGAGELQLREDLADAMLESGAPQRDTGIEGKNAFVQMKQLPPVITKVVNPVGTVITLQSDEEYENVDRKALSESFIQENCDETLFRPIVNAKLTIEKISDQQENNFVSKESDEISNCNSNVEKLDKKTSLSAESVISEISNLNLSRKKNRKKECVSEYKIKCTSEIDEFMKSPISERELQEIGYKDSNPNSKTVTDHKIWKNLNDKSIKPLKSSLKSSDLLDSKVKIKKCSKTNKSNDIEINTVKENTNDFPPASFISDIEDKSFENIKVAKRSAHSAKFIEINKKHLSETNIKKNTYPEKTSNYESCGFTKTADLVTSNSTFKNAEVDEMCLTDAKSENIFPAQDSVYNVKKVFKKTNNYAQVIEESKKRTVVENNPLDDINFDQCIISSELNKTLENKTSVKSNSSSKSNLIKCIENQNKKIGNALEENISSELHSDVFESKNSIKKISNKLTDVQSKKNELENEYTLVNAISDHTIVSPEHYTLHEKKKTQNKNSNCIKSSFDTQNKKIEVENVICNLQLENIEQALSCTDKQSDRHVSKKNTNTAKKKSNLSDVSTSIFPKNEFSIDTDKLLGSVSSSNKKMSTVVKSVSDTIDFEKNIKDDHFEKDNMNQSEKPGMNITKKWSEVTMSKPQPKIDQFIEDNVLHLQDTLSNKISFPEEISNIPDIIRTSSDVENKPFEEIKDLIGCDLKIKNKKGKKIRTKNMIDELQEPQNKKSIQDDKCCTSNIDQLEILEVDSENYSAVNFVCKSNIEGVNTDFNMVKTDEFIENADQESDEPFLSLETDIPELEPLLGDEIIDKYPPLNTGIYSEDFIPIATNEDTINATSSSQTESDDSCKIINRHDEIKSAPLETEQVDQIKVNKKKSKKKRR